MMFPLNPIKSIYSPICWGIISHLWDASPRPACEVRSEWWESSHPAGAAWFSARLGYRKKIQRKFWNGKIIHKLGNFIHTYLFIYIHTYIYKYIHIYIYIRIYICIHYHCHFNRKREVPNRLISATHNKARDNLILRILGSSDTWKATWKSKSMGCLPVLTVCIWGIVYQPVGRWYKASWTQMMRLLIPAVRILVPFAENLKSE